VVDRNEELHTWNTPNGRKISVALEEMGAAIQVYPVDITTAATNEAGILAISPKTRSPRSSIPRAVWKRVSVFDPARSCVFARRQRKLPSPAPLIERSRCWNGLMWQMAALGRSPGKEASFHRTDRRAGPRLGLETLFDGERTACMAC